MRKEDANLEFKIEHETKFHAMRLKEIRLQEFTTSDLHLLRSIFQNPDIMEYTLDDCYSDEELEIYYNKILKNNASSQRNTFEYAVFQDETFIGFADFIISQKNASGGIAEIGYLLLPEYWGKGLGTLIVKKLMEICFNQHKLHRLYARCNSNNTGSIKVLEKNNMQLEGQLKRQRYKKGQWVDEYIYAILNLPDTQR